MYIIIRKKYCSLITIYFDVSIRSFFTVVGFRCFILCIDLDIYFRLFITKNAENSACQEDQVAAIIDFVTIDLVVVLCLVYGQLAPWSVRP